MRRFWVSWYASSLDFEVHTPWWVSGYRDDTPVVCAAVIANDADDAQSVIRACHDDPQAEIEWRFVEERPDDWSPFNSRFKRADWMRWTS